MKHVHNWQFVKEVDIDYFSKVVWKEEDGTYSKFVCECGAYKLVKQFKEK
jgi:hypothetical protein